MLNTPVSLRRPGRCFQCDVRGTVDIHRTICGEKLDLHWRCSNCKAEWPVTPIDQYGASGSVEKMRTLVGIAPLLARTKALWTWASLVFRSTSRPSSG